MLSSGIGHRGSVNFGLNQRILIVEDNEFARENLKNYFEGEGDSVDFATSAQDGLKKAKTENYDLYLLDVDYDDFPEDEDLRDGSELANRLVTEVGVDPKKIGAISKDPMNNSFLNVRVKRRTKSDVGLQFDQKNALGSSKKARELFTVALSKIFGDKNA